MNQVGEIFPKPGITDFTDESDYAFVAIAHRFNRFSPLLTRTVQDGNTIRAIIGSWAALLMPIGLLLGIIAAFNTGGQALPPAWGIVAAIMAVAIFDAFAGFIAGFVFFCIRFANWKHH